MNKILRELEHHAPFTAFGALTGIVLMVIFRSGTSAWKISCFQIIFFGLNQKKQIDGPTM